MSFSHILSLHNHIGLDLDDTLTDTMQDGLEKLHRLGKLLGVKSVEDIHTFNWMEIPHSNITQEEYLDFWSTHSLSGLTPYIEAQNFVKSLVELQKSISIITARNASDHTLDAKKWLKQHFPDIDEKDVHFANKSRGESTPKSELCKKYGITLMIDDAFHNAVDLVENDIACILLEKPWNRDNTYTHPLLYRAKDWNEIITHVH